MSPEAERIVPPAPAESTWTSPEAVFTSARPPTAPSLHVAARRADLGVALDILGLHVARGGVHLEPAQPAIDVDVGRGDVDVHVGAVRRADADLELAVAAEASSASRSRCRGRAARPSGRRGRLGSPPRRRPWSERRPSRSSMRPAAMPKRSFGASGVANSCLTATASSSAARAGGPTRSLRAVGGLPLGEMSEGP